MPWGGDWSSDFHIIPSYLLHRPLRLTLALRKGRFLKHWMEILNSRMLSSSTLLDQMCKYSMGWTFRFKQVRLWLWWVQVGVAKAPCFDCCNGSMTLRKAE